MEKENFYIFLDIDGVMWDWIFIKDQIVKKILPMGGIIHTYNPESVKALNFLIVELNKTYYAKLVISGSMREKVVPILYENGLIYSGKIDTTPYDFDRIRGLEIKKYLEDKQDKQNVVILEDEPLDIYSNFEKSKVIKTNIFTNSLKLNQVKEFLNNLRINNCEKDVLER